MGFMNRWMQHVFQDMIVKPCWASKDLSKHIRIISSSWHLGSTVQFKDTHRQRLQMRVAAPMLPGFTENWFACFDMNLTGKYNAVWRDFMDSSWTYFELYLSYVIPESPDCGAFQGPKAALSPTASWPCSRKTCWANCHSPGHSTSEHWHCPKASVCVSISRYRAKQHLVCLVV